jgi:type II secretory pathway pseudopilin PulG
VQAGMDANFAALNKISGPIQQYHYWFSLIAIPNYRRAFQTAVQKETQRQLTVTAIALKRYELRNGRPSPNLQALVPEFLPALPRDYFSTNHLQYRIKKDGSPVLYSVGTDGHDDQGDPTPAQNGQAPELWSGRDAVWPQLSVRTHR